MSDSKKLETFAKGMRVKIQRVGQYKLKSDTGIFLHYLGNPKYASVLVDGNKQPTYFDIRRLTYMGTTVKINKVSRPKTGKKKPPPRVVTVRFTDEQYARLLCLARENGRSLNKFILAATLNSGVLIERLADFAEFGVRHDTTPTIGGSIDPENPVLGFYRYIQGIDHSVRNEAKNTLQRYNDVHNADVLGHVRTEEANQEVQENPPSQTEQN
jgi:hypothetical protein